jgi:hypothetical protein
LHLAFDLYSTLRKLSFGAYLLSAFYMKGGLMPIKQTKEKVTAAAAVTVASSLAAAAWEVPNHLDEAANSLAKPKEVPVDKIGSLSVNNTGLGVVHYTHTLETAAHKAVAHQKHLVHRRRIRIAQRHWLDTLGQCESEGSGGYQADTGNGFKGRYQFTDKTWQSLDTGYPSADQAPPAVQDHAIIENTLRSPDGIASQNPKCYQTTGINAFPPH